MLPNGNNMKSIRSSLRAKAATRRVGVRNDAKKHSKKMESRHRVWEQALRESQEQYRMLLDGIENYAIFMMDPQGRIVSWNAGAERIKGYEADEIIGRNFSCFFSPENIARGRPEDVAAAVRFLCGPGARYITGQAIHSNGGAYLGA